MRRIIQAVSLLTVFPIHVDWGQDAALGRAMACFPLVGALLGSLLWASGWLLCCMGCGDHVSLLAAVILVTLWAAMTGGLHLDGWGDCCDALLVHASREKRHMILKDPHLGSFGVTGLVLLLFVKTAAVQGLLVASQKDWRALLPLFLAPVLARWMIVVVAFALPLAKPDGMAAWCRQGLRRQDVLVATLLAVLVSSTTGMTGWFLLTLALGVGGLLARFAAARLGGVTGDVYGAVVEAVEAMTVTAAACLQGAG